MAFDTSLLESPLRSLEEGIVDALKLTFEGATVLAHTGEIDQDSVKRLSLAKLGLLATIALGHGSTSAPASNLRVDVTWGIFIVASARTVGAVSVPAVKVGCSITNYVLQLAYQCKWGLGSAINPCLPGDLRFSNLGVGLKSTKDYVEKEGLSLWVVWGRQQLDLGENITTGGVVLPPLNLIDGLIQDQGLEGQEPEVPVSEPIEQSSLFARAVGALRGRPKLAIPRSANDDLYQQVALRINGFAASELRKTAR